MNIGSKLCGNKMCYAAFFKGGTLFEYLQQRNGQLLEEEVIYCLVEKNDHSFILSIPAYKTNTCTSYIKK